MTDPAQMKSVANLEGINLRSGWEFSPDNVVDEGGTVLWACQRCGHFEPKPVHTDTQMITYENLDDPRSQPKLKYHNRKWICCQFCIKVNHNEEIKVLRQLWSQKKKCWRKVQKLKDRLEALKKELEDAKEDFEWKEGEFNGLCAELSNPAEHAPW